ncbi:MAG: type VI secretion system protein TssL, long form [Proteobacteria bacterium]|nr:type VI secretion system protein TssL, long form [Pseudomonadota bacterium]
MPGGRARAAAAAPPPADAPPRQPAAPAAAVAGPDLVQVGGSRLIAAAAPLLQLLSRLRNTLSQPDPGALRERAVAEMRRFEQTTRDAGIPMQQLQPAHYALCASLDDVVQATPWGREGGWAARSLVTTFHPRDRQVQSGVRFFQLLDQVKQHPGNFLPVIELMYLCLSLGFQGQYRLSPRGPAELDKVREETYAVIARQRPAADPELSPHWRGMDAPYRPVKAEVPVWVAATAGLALLGALFAWVMFTLNGRSDALFTRMMGMPPTQMPMIQRVALVQPPPAPPPQLPGAMDKLRGFLRPEIEQGLVTVVGTDAVPVVRIRNRGMFLSGSAEVQPRFNSLLERIGQALSTERGAVQVLGYTDNQPIRTIQFPSNFQLSAARAKAAAAIIARTIGEPGRITTEGRADADPIGNNATQEGREENRRIEVVLRREG